MAKEKRRNSDRDSDDKYIGKTNLPDYNVPSGVQFTENMIEEIAEAACRETPEMPPEK